MNSQMALINRYPMLWIKDLADRIALALGEAPGSRAFLLVDGAFNPACYRTLGVWRNAPDWHPLFSARPGADAETLALSPALLDLSGAGWSDWEAFLRLTDGLPMLSWIVTIESFEELVTRLAPWCVVDADGQEVVLRFADTRRLPDIVASLTPEQHGQLFGPASYWQYVTRAAQWASLPLPAQSRPAAETISLNEQQCARLIGACEADGILASLHRHTPSLIDRFTPAARYEKVQRALAQADQYRIEQPPEREEFCALMLELPKLASQGEAQACLAELRENNMTFNQAIDTLRQMAA